MLVKDLIDLLEDFKWYELDLSIGPIKDNTDYGISYLNFKKICVEDVSHSEKLLKLGFEDELEGELEIKY